MLIVNADDLGLNRIATDNALSCFLKGRISSATAMVFMEDSERAARIVKTSGIDVGLHINFIEGFSAKSTPGRLRESQERLSRFLKKSKYALLVYNPFLRNDFQYVYQAQFDEFIRIFDRSPSHLDGHQHMHLASNMILDCIVQHGSRIRRSFSFYPGEKNIFNRSYRYAVDWLLLKRYSITDYFFALSQNMTINRLERLIQLAKESRVELMAHPEVVDEFTFLISDKYWQAISKVKLGNYLTI
jgi:hypothetical protein